MELEGYGCISLEELTIHVPDDRDEYWDETERDYISVDWTEYVNLSNLPSLKILNFVSDAEGVEVRVYGMSSSEEENYTEFTGSASWYENLLNEALLAAENGYRYYDKTLDDGTEVHWIVKYDADKSWTADEIPTTKIKSRAQVGNQIIYTCYAPALIGEDLVPGVACYKSVETEYLWFYRGEVYEEVCGTEAYADCEYSETITVNGVEYPVEVYEDTDD